MNKIKYLIKIYHNTNIKDYKILYEFLIDLNKNSLNDLNNKKLLVSMGFIDNKNKQFGILLENIDKVDMIQYINIFIAKIKLIPDMSLSVITNISILEIKNDMWEDYSYLLENV